MGGNFYFYKYPILGGPIPPQTQRFDALVYHFIFLIKGYDFSSKPIFSKFYGKVGVISWFLFHLI